MEALISLMTRLPKSHTIISELLCFLHKLTLFIWSGYYSKAQVSRERNRCRLGSMRILLFALAVTFCFYLSHFQIFVRVTPNPLSI